MPSLLPALFCGSAGGGLPGGPYDGGVKACAAGPLVHWMYPPRPDGSRLTRISTSNPAGAAVFRAVAGSGRRNATAEER
ncbi:hypothetical protein AB0L59_23190 [Streptomyces sp. NPDC052109]|uniref:hypothetical protein n=1 Tax=Streptomyces sp. NPDC052109 TaxID=3155527 RepID=UPI003448EDE7